MPSPPHQSTILNLSGGTLGSEDESVDELADDSSTADDNTQATRDSPLRTSTPTLFRGQDSDEEREESPSTPAFLAQFHSVSADSNPESMSPSREKLSLDTYGPSSFTPKRRIFVNTVSRKYGKIRGIEEAEGADATEDLRARVRLATSPPTPTTPVLTPARGDLPTTPLNSSQNSVTFCDVQEFPSCNESHRSTSSLGNVVAPRLPLDDIKAAEDGDFQQTHPQISPRPESEMTGQRRVGLGEVLASPCASPSRKLCIATRDMRLNEVIEISSASEAGADSVSDSEDCVECDAEGNVLLRTPAVIADEIERRAVAGMARLAETQRTPTKSRGTGMQQPIKSPNSVGKRRKLSSTSSPSSSRIKKRYECSDDDKSLLAGPSTPSKRRRRPHEGPKRVLPGWQAWEDLLITHEASQGRLGSAGHILVKINEKREGQGLELREAQDIRNRWTKLKATMQESVVALHRGA